ncbi:heat-shock protein Hsp90 [Dialister sp.]|uniref:heat-shock protein Hsp90 n=1 Tax=Dialister sp. TaxID=1955814 RepID=UPI003F00E03F
MAKEEIIEKVKEVMNAPSCYEGLKKVCEVYLKALGTEEEKGAAAALKEELKADVNSLDNVIPFFESEEGAKLLGADTAKSLAAAAHAAKEKGVKYCICPACTAGGWLLDHEAEW